MSKTIADNFRSPLFPKEMKKKTSVGFQRNLISDLFYLAGKAEGRHIGVHFTSELNMKFLMRN